MEAQEFLNPIFILVNPLCLIGILLLFSIIKKCMVMRLMYSLYTLPKLSDPENYIHLRCYYCRGCSIYVIRIPVY